MSNPCTWQDCSKVFRSEEQLEKHERGHTGRARHRCSQCGKSYARSDVLSRHMVRQHGASPPVMGRPRRVPCSNCQVYRYVCHRTPPESCSRCLALGVTCKYVLDPAGSASPSRRDRSIVGQLSPVPVSTEQPLQWVPEPSGVAELSQLTPTSQIAPDVDILDANTSSDLLLLPATTDSTEHSDWFSLLKLGTHTLQPEDWSLPEPELDGDLFDILNTEAPNTPSWDFLGSLVGPSQPALRQEVDQSPEQLHGTPSEIPDGQPEDSPWPHIDKPCSSDVYISLPRSDIQPPVSIIPRYPLLESTRQRMITTVSRSHQCVWPIVDTTNFPSTDTLTVCITLYQRYFHDWLPIIERATFKMEESAPLIMMSMSAIGAMYNQEGLKRLGVALSELVRRAVVFIRESDRRFMFETQIIQAYLLQTYFGFFCGSQRSFQQAEWSRSALVIAAKRMHLLRPGMSATQSLYSSNANPIRQEIAKAEKEDRRRARLGWGIYLLDCQLACLLNLPAQLSLHDVDTTFPTLASLQQADWIEGERWSFTDVLDGLLTDGIVPMALDDLGYSIVSYTLYRLCMDASNLQSLHRHQPGLSRYKLPFPSHIKHHPQILLGRIASHTLNLATTPTPLLMSCAALAHHSHLHFSFPGFLEQVKVAAGKSGRIESRIAAREKLERWVNQDKYSTRVIFAHAGMLACLLKRYTFDTPTEVIWTFDTALCLWAILRFSFEPIASGTPTTIISWSETPHIETWVLTGGGAVVQGVGDVSVLSPSGVLQHFAKQLETLSWGLAGQYRQILCTLMEEP